MPRRQDNPYAPHDWAPHEKPALLGSPSTPLHSPAKRLAYGVVGLLVCLTGALGNAVVTANLQLLQGTFAAWSTEIAWLPAVYVMTNVSINLLLVKFRQQFGLRAFTEGLASPERADYRHHRLVASHSPGAPLFHRTAADR